MPRKSSSVDKAVLIVRVQPEIKKKFTDVATVLDVPQAELYRMHLRKLCLDANIPTEF